jgi:hypothetical protein
MRVIALLVIIVWSALSFEASAQTLNYKQQQQQTMSPGDLAGQWMVVMNWGGGQNNNSWEIWDIAIQGNQVTVTQRSGQLGMIPGVPDIHARQMPITSLQFDGTTLLLTAEVVPTMVAQMQARVAGAGKLVGTWQQVAYNSMFALPGGGMGNTALPFQMEKCTANMYGLVECKPLF